MKIKTINLEQGMPTADTAGRRLQFEINTARRDGTAALKVIHGYGSTGAGGRIKGEVKRLLAAAKKGKMIKEYVSGEEWSIFSPRARAVLDLCPDLRQDRDLENHNNGISIVLL